MAAGVTSPWREWRHYPHACAKQLNALLADDGITVKVCHHDPRLTVLDVRIDPPPAHCLPGYPAEHLRVVISSDLGVQAVPIGADRAWRHRYPIPCESNNWVTSLTGPLCLEYPLDPPHLRWSWSDGLDTYLRIAQRHLWSEEFWRRHG